MLHNAATGREATMKNYVAKPATVASSAHGGRIFTTSALKTAFCLGFARESEYLLRPFLRLCSPASLRQCAGGHMTGTLPSSTALASKCGKSVVNTATMYSYLSRRREWCVHFAAFKEVTVLHTLLADRLRRSAVSPEEGGNSRSGSAVATTSNTKTSQAVSFFLWVNTANAIPTSSSHRQVDSCNHSTPP